MIIPTLLLLALQKPDLETALRRYRDYMAAHPVLSADVSISGGSTGKGIIIVHRGAPNEIKVDWHCSLEGSAYHFISDGKNNIDVLPSEAVYDRVVDDEGPFPAGRIALAFGYPRAIVQGAVPLAGMKQNAVTSRKGSQTEVKATEHTMVEDIVITADFADSGQLVRYSVEKGPKGHMSAETDIFSNYKFGSAAAQSSFVSSPPIGYSPYSFEAAPIPLPTDTKLPPIPLTGSGGMTTLSTVAAKPLAFIVFLDAYMPDGLAASLIRLNNSVPITVISLRGSGSNIDKLPNYQADSAGFDQAGISVTPQFYLVRNGAVVQTWQGFRHDAAGSFENEVRDIIKGD